MTKRPAIFAALLALGLAAPVTGASAYGFPGSIEEVAPRLFLEDPARNGGGRSTAPRPTAGASRVRRARATPTSRTGR